MSRKRKSKRITVERIENALDILAGIVAGAKHDEALLMAPLWHRLVRELADMRDAESAVAAAKERNATNLQLKRSRPV